MYANMGQPGATALNSTSEAELLWGGDESRIQVLKLSSQFSSSMADAANTPTTVVRKGLLLGRIASSRKLIQWDSSATDGSQYIVGVLPQELVMIDELGTAVEKTAPYLVQAPVKASQLRIKGAALVGHADEYLARNLLHRSGFRLDDDPQGWLAGVNPRIQTKATDYTVVAADNGSIFHAITANATFTLPTLVAGLNFDFIRMSDHNLVVTSAVGDDIVVGNDLSADSVTYSSASNKIGARIRVASQYVNGTLKWVAEIVPAPFSTGAFLTQTLAT